jgi:putative inorganic carbon (HCO3(-)) transporter
MHSKSTAEIKPGVAGLAFLIFSASLMIGNDSLWLLLFTILSFILASFILSFFRLSFLYHLLILVLPLSISISLGNSDTTMLTPSEPLTGLIALTFFFSFISGKEKISIGFLRHPLTLFILAYLFFTFISTLFSTMPSVSIKSMLVKSAYILVFYFIPHSLFSKSLPGMKNTYLFFTFALLPVSIFTLIQHGKYDFTKDYSSMTSIPFFSDHTIYSAALTFLIPPLAILIFSYRTLNFPKQWIPVSITVLAIFLMGLFFSYCRAAWISLLVSCLVLVVLIIKIRLRTFMFFLFIVFTLLYVSREPILYEIRQNRNDSNRKDADITEQTKSITNITNDQSNAERLNRWSCAIRMAADKPLTGFGAGTFQFQYLSYQQTSEMTRISITSPYNVSPGRGGSAHSEYLLALAESGWGACLSFCGIAFCAFLYGIRNYYRSTDKQIRLLLLMAIGGLSTYFTHAFFNNFLDIDKLAFLFWISLSIIAGADLQERKTKAKLKAAQ